MINKTETILKNYALLKKAVEKVDIVDVLDKALQELSDDEYYEIIPLIYFEHRSREYIAEYFDVSVTTISRQKKRLINNLSILLYPNDFINAL